MTCSCNGHLSSLFCNYIAQLGCHPSQNQMCSQHLVQAVIAKLTTKDTGRFLGPDGQDIDY